MDFIIFMQRVQNNMVIALETCPSDAQIQSENGSRSVIYKGIPLNVVVFFLFGFLMESKKLVIFVAVVLCTSLRADFFCLSP